MKKNSLVGAYSIGLLLSLNLYNVELSAAPDKKGAPASTTCQVVIQYQNVEPPKGAKTAAVQCYDIVSPGACAKGACNAPELKSMANCKLFPGQVKPIAGNKTLAGVCTP